LGKKEGLLLSFIVVKLFLGTMEKDLSSMPWQLRLVQISSIKHTSFYMQILQLINQCNGNFNTLIILQLTFARATLIRNKGSFWIQLRQL
jgi:hypothetical protein